MGKKCIIRQKLIIVKRLRKIIRKLVLIFCILKKKKNTPLILQNITCEKQLIHSMIQIKKKEDAIILVKKNYLRYYME